MYDIFQSGNLLYTAGRPVLTAVIIAEIACWFIFKPLALLPMGFFLFSLYFFRNPQRTPIPSATNTNLISPADGKVIEIDYHNKLHADLPIKLSIFLSPLDVHVNWTPCDAQVIDIQHYPGKYLVAYAPKSSEINERLDLTLERTFDRQKIVVCQVAGFIARRIICWAQQGDVISSDLKYGMIRFGSRVDLFLPAHTQLKVAIGQRVIGGHDVVADMPMQSL